MATVGKKPVVVIVGPTASGKTSLAIEVAKENSGEIICADSRTVYKGMDIGTAKPTAEEQSGIPHWGLDIVELGAKFSVSGFKDYAQKKLLEIQSRGNLPIIVGGSGLYVDALVLDYSFGASSVDKQRDKFGVMTVEELTMYCDDNNIIIPENRLNKRYLIRSIENNRSSLSKKSEPDSNIIVVGITTDKKELMDRIRLRADDLFEKGVVEEAKMLSEKLGWENEAMKSNIYKISKEYFEGLIDLDEFKQKFVTSDWRLAKKQLTWFKRNKFIHWVQLNDAKDYINTRVVEFE